MTSKSIRLFLFTKVIIIKRRKEGKRQVVAEHCSAKAQRHRGISKFKFKDQSKNDPTTLCEFCWTSKPNLNKPNPTKPA